MILLFAAAIAGFCGTSGVGTIVSWLVTRCEVVAYAQKTNFN